MPFLNSTFYLLTLLTKVDFTQYLQTPLHINTHTLLWKRQGNHIYMYIYLTLVFVSIGKRWALSSKAWNFWTGVGQGSQGNDEDDLEKYSYLWNLPCT